MTDYTSAHTTEHELEFIKEIALNGYKKTKNRPILALTGYIEAAKKRTKWGRIDKSNVLRYANIKLEDLLRGK
jgi:hypothetical protein